MLSTQPYKGTRDFYPDEMRKRRWMFGVMRTAVESFGFEEYDGPMLEPFELYAAKSGEEIVNQQLYSMIDRGERKIAVRPEMTPTMARMVAGKLHELPKPVRWFSIPNVWRYERPQRGRLREHWQLNVDILGGDRVLADAECLLVALSIMKAFKGLEWVAIKVNHRGLVDFVFREKLGFEAELALKVSKAVDARAKIGEEGYRKWLSELNVSDDKASQMEAFFKADLKTMQSLYPCQPLNELLGVIDAISAAGFRSQIHFDPSVMRGLDYYTGTVFEMYDTSPENPRAIFGGGRYDNLIGLFGKDRLSGVGFGMGDVTLAHFLETHRLLPEQSAHLDVFIPLVDIKNLSLCTGLAQELRAHGFRVASSLEAVGLGAQLKVADKHKARVALILGENEIAKKAVAVKDLLVGTQIEVSQSELVNTLKGILK